jgi:hypothetical protein
MEMYAIKIQKSQLPLITFLNGGVTPDIEKKTTYLVFDAVLDSNVPNEIVTERELAERFDIKGWQPFVLALKKGVAQEL